MTSPDNKMTVSAVSEKQIENWKKSYGDIFVYEADAMSCYLKRPGRTVLSAATASSQNDPMKFAEVIINNCWLGGDDILRTEDKYFMGLQQQVNELIEIKVGKLKKL